MFRPDRIVCTHCLPAEILSHEIARDRGSVPVYVQVTDFDLHPMWVTPGMAGYFAANAEIALRLTGCARLTRRRWSPAFPSCRTSTPRAARRVIRRGMNSRLWQFAVAIST